jgi:hypothetical protein
MQVQRLEVRLVYMAKSDGLESPRNAESLPMPELMNSVPKLESQRKFRDRDLRGKWRGSSSKLEPLPL